MIIIIGKHLTRQNFRIGKIPLFVPVPLFYVDVHKLWSVLFKCRKQPLRTTGQRRVVISNDYLLIFIFSGVV